MLCSSLIFPPRVWRQDEHLLLRHYLSFLRQYADIRHVLLKEKSEAHLHNNKKCRQILNVSWFVQKLNNIAICRGRRPRRPILRHKQHNINVILRKLLRYLFNWVLTSRSKGFFAFFIIYIVSFNYFLFHIVFKFIYVIMNYNWQYYCNKEVYETPFQKSKKKFIY